MTLCICDSRFIIYDARNERIIFCEELYFIVQHSYVKISLRQQVGPNQQPGHATLQTVTYGTVGTRVFGAAGPDRPVCWTLEPI